MIVMLSRISTSNIDESADKEHKIVLENGNANIRKIVDDLDISYGIAQQILVDILYMKRVIVRLV